MTQGQDRRLPHPQLWQRQPDIDEKLPIFSIFGVFFLFKASVADYGIGLDTSCVVTAEPPPRALLCFRGAVSALTALGNPTPYQKIFVKALRLV